MTNKKSTEIVVRLPEAGGACGATGEGLAHEAHAICPAAITTLAIGALDRTYNPSTDPAVLYIDGNYNTKKSQQTAYEALRRIARSIGLSNRDDWRHIPWARLTNRETTLIRRRLLDTGAAPKSVQSTLSVLRGVLGKAFDLGLIDAEQYQRAIRIPRVRARRIPAGRMLKMVEIERLRAYIEAQTSPYRELLRALFFGALLGAGLRREEVAALRADAITDDKLRVFGKGQKERDVALPRFARRAFAAWLDIRKGLPSSLETMFVRVDKLGRVRDEPLTPWAVWNTVATICDELSIEDIAPHDFRRTFASVQLDRGVDIVTVAAQMGHSQTSTTAGYDRRGDAAASKAADVLDELFGDD